MATSGLQIEIQLCLANRQAQVLNEEVQDARLALVSCQNSSAAAQLTLQGEIDALKKELQAALNDYSVASAIATETTAAVVAGSQRLVQRQVARIAARMRARTCTLGLAWWRNQVSERRLLKAKVRRAVAYWRNRNLLGGVLAWKSALRARRRLRRSVAHCPVFIAPVFSVACIINVLRP
jgi:hypothetical protein